MRMLIGSFALLILLLVVFILPGVIASETPNRAFSVPGFISLFAGIAFAQMKLKDADRTNGAASYQRYQTDMLIALALMEFCALVGIFIVGDGTLSYIMAGAALASILLFVYPPVNQYCDSIAQSPPD